MRSALSPRYNVPMSTPTRPHRGSPRVRLLIAVLTVLPPCALHAQDPDPQSPEQQYEQFFGDHERRARASASRDDDLALATQQLELARAIEEERPDLMALLCNKAHDLAQRHPTGHPVAIDAMRLLIDSRPDEAGSAWPRLIDARRDQLPTLRGDERDRATDQYLQDLVAAGEHADDAGDLDQAVRWLRQATAVARSRRSDMAHDIQNRLVALREKQAVLNRVELIERQLHAADPDDNARAAHDLIQLCLVELDDPNRATRYLDAADDEQLIMAVMLANTPPDQLNAEQARSLADWYKATGDRSTPAQRLTLYRKAADLYQRFLEIHPGAGVERTRAQLTADMLAKSIDQLEAQLNPDSDSRISFRSFVRDVQAISAGYTRGDFAKIAIDGRLIIGAAAEQPPVTSDRGLNVVAVKGSRVLWAKTYDTFADQTAAERLAGDIKNLPDDTFVVVAAEDEPTSKLGLAGRAALQAIGADTFPTGYRSAYLCIGQKGLTPGKAIVLADRAGGPVTFPPR